MPISTLFQKCMDAVLENLIDYDFMQLEKYLIVKYPTVTHVWIKITSVSLWIKSAIWKNYFQSETIFMQIILYQISNVCDEYNVRITVVLYNQFLLLFEISFVPRTWRIKTTYANSIQSNTPLNIIFHANESNWKHYHCNNFL